MKMRTVLNVLLVILFATAMGCATLESAGHKYVMRGSVLEVSDGTAFLCIGTEQGAKVGQEFTVRRYVRTVTSPKGQQPAYRVETVGRVQITNTESHMANAKILTGDVKENDVVELNP
jgi:hypothetical protein